MRNLYSSAADPDLALDQCARLRGDDPDRDADPLYRAHRCRVIPYRGLPAQFVGFVMIASFFIWLAFYVLSDRINAYHTEFSPRKHFIGSFRQVYYYAFGIFSGDPDPFTPTVITSSIRCRARSTTSS